MRLRLACPDSLSRDSSTTDITPRLEIVEESEVLVPPANLIKHIFNKWAIR
jgi:hypothetical protein